MILILKHTRTLGPLISIIIKLIADLLRFAIIYCMILLLFALFGYFLFIETDRFENLYQSIKTLFWSSLANVDISNVQMAFLKSYYLDIYIMVYTIISNVLILNLLIAIMSKTYSYF